VPVYTFVEVSLGDGLLADVGHLLDVVHTSPNDVGAPDDVECSLEVVAGRLSAARLHPQVKHHQRSLRVRVEVRLDVAQFRRPDAELRRQLDPVRLDRLGDVRQTQLRLGNVLLCATLFNLTITTPYSIKCATLFLTVTPVFLGGSLNFLH